MDRIYSHKFEAPNKPGTMIFVQTDEEKESASRLIGAILRRWTPPRYFFHLRKGGHLKALHQHQSDRFFARLDLEKFFGTVSRNKVSHAMKKIGFPFVDAEVIARRSCVSHNGERFLPFGYVQSPLMASVVLDTGALGRQLRKAAKTDVRVSVFMDDIVLSHRDAIEPLENTVAALTDAARDARFHLSVEKSQAPADVITAFNIILRNGSLELTAERYEEFARRVLAQGDGHSTKGILGYVGCINEGQRMALKTLI